MMTEIVQMDSKERDKIDFSDPDHTKLVLEILKEISEGKIISCHMSPQFAKNALKLYHQWDKCHHEPGNEEGKKEDE